MIFLAIYPLLFWVLAFWQRRRWQGFALAAAGPLPFVVIAGGIGDQGMRLLVLSLALVFGLGGLFIAMQPRRAPGERCLKCDYLLEGNVTGVCPECGEPIERPRTRARRLHPSAPSPARASAEPGMPGRSSR